MIMIYDPWSILAPVALPPKRELSQVGEDALANIREILGIQKQPRIEDVVVQTEIEVQETAEQEAQEEREAIQAENEAEDEINPDHYIFE